MNEKRKAMHWKRKELDYLATSAENYADRNTTALGGESHIQ